MVLAAEGSAPAGELEPLPQPPGAIDDAGRAAVHAELRRRLALAIWRVRPDVVHFHGIDFHRYLPRTGPPALVTLHLPLDWYPPRALAPERPATWLIPVSRDQARRAPPGARLSAPIENGVDLAAFRPARKRRYAVALGASARRRDSTTHSRRRAPRACRCCSPALYFRTLIMSAISKARFALGSTAGAAGSAR